MVIIRRLALFLIGIGMSASWCFGSQVDGGMTKLKPYPEEKAAKIGRGFVALPVDSNKVFLTWRLLTRDAADTSFDIFRIDGSDQNKKYLGSTRATYFIDSVESKNFLGKYELVVKGNSRRPASAETELAPNAERLTPGTTSLFYDLGENYQQARLAVGDLTGDGELEVVIQFSDDKNLDPYERFKNIRKSTDTIKVAAFLKTGEILWKMDLGWGIEAGKVYSPMVLWDIDADGKTEVILKTNPSGNPTDYENERITILNGESGKILREARWPSPSGLLLGPKKTTRGTMDVYNNLSRNYLAIAHLDGKNPAIVAARGAYLAQKIVAFDINLVKKWEKLIGLNSYNPLRQIWKLDYKLDRIMARVKKDDYRGSHTMPIVDIDGDGKEEILWGDMCIGDGGRELWKIKERFPYNGHVDVVFAADVNPDIKGYEVFYAREGWGRSNNNIGMALFDHRGELLWGKWGYTHIDGGWVAKIVPQSVGLQSFGYDIRKKKWKKGGVTYDNVTGYLWDYQGGFIKEVSAAWIRSFPVNWDGDDIKEICLSDGSIVDHEGRVIDKIGGKPLWGGDIYGDQAEEIVVTNQGKKVYIGFNVNTIRGEPQFALITDRRYRNDLSRTAMHSRVIPMEGGYKYTIE